jgi:hypothetical protein
MLKDETKLANKGFKVEGGKDRLREELHIMGGHSISPLF